jgi:hypothetical protein
VILAATKGRSPEQISEAIKAGITVIGESRVQELLEKLPFLPQGLRVDFIGHLQTNKVRDVVQHCYLIHSVDSVHLAQEVNNEAKKIGKAQNILLEINLSGEETKFGFKKNEVVSVFPKLLELKNIKIIGLMTVAPQAENGEVSRVVFRELREFKSLLESKFKVPLSELSMGMSNDYQIAVEEGATIIRLGRIIFGPLHQ